MERGGKHVLRNFIILVLGLFLAPAAFPKEATDGLPGWLTVDRKGEFSGGNWTSPDLFRWKLIMGKNLEETMVDDRDGIIARGKTWNCRIEKPFRSQMPLLSARSHMLSERRDIICTGKGSEFRAKISVTSIINFREGKPSLYHTYDSWICVGESGSDECTSIGLRGEIWIDENKDGKQEEGEWKHNVDLKIP
jgi:hypothetical protein